MIPVTSEMLCALRKSVSELTSQERFGHVLSVEQTAKDMARLYCPEKENLLCAAALLHDVTKELSLDEQLSIMRDRGAEPTADLINAPATLHAVTAAMVIPERYPEFADVEIIDAVRYHTTGRENMTLSEKIIYLADYIEPTRKYEGCIRLRELFFSADFDKMSDAERIRHLDVVILKSLDGTLEHLQEKGGFISPDTKKAREYLARKIKP